MSTSIGSPAEAYHRGCRTLKGPTALQFPATTTDPNMPPVNMHFTQQIGEAFAQTFHGDEDSESLPTILDGVVRAPSQLRYSILKHGRTTSMAHSLAYTGEEKALAPSCSAVLSRRDSRRTPLHECALMLTCFVRPPSH